MTSKQKHILITAPYFLPHTGGLERYVYDISRRLQKKGWKVSVLTTEEKDKQMTVEDREGVTVYRLPFKFKVSNTPFSFSWLWKIPKIIKEINPDIINVHTPVPGIGDIASFFSGKKSVYVTYHAGSMKKGSIIADSVVGFYENGPLKLMLKKAKHIICSSDSVRIDFLSKYLVKSSTVSPGVDCEEFFADETMKDEKPTILFVGALGRAEQYKGLWTLIDALKIVKESIPNVQLNIVSEGDMMEEYKTYIQNNHLMDNVSFKGRLFGEEHTKEFKSAHVFALPTANDSSPMVISEAMATGLPVISTNIGGIPKMVQDGETGYIISPNDEKALSQKLLYIFNNPEIGIEMGRKGREKAEDSYSWEERIDRYEKIFNIENGSPTRTIVQCNAFYPPHLGGVEQVMANISGFLARAGQKTIVLTSNKKFIEHTEKRKNLTIKRLAKFDLFNVPIAPMLIVRLFQIPKFSIIHAHLAQAFWPECVLLVAKLRKIPYIAHFHLDIEPSSSLGFLFTIYKKIIWGPFLRGAVKVIVCSPDQVSIIETKYKVTAEKICVIENAVDEDFFIERNYTQPTDKLRLLYVGRLASQKRVERLVETMSQITIPANLTIVGDGNLRNKLEDLVKEKSLKNITFVGSKKREEIKGYYKTHDALLISSDKEGLPLVVLEAMASGLPIVGTRVIGISGLLEGTGILIDEPYANNFALEISRLWNSDNEFSTLSKKSIIKAKQYTWELFMTKLDVLYKTIPV